MITFLTIIYVVFAVLQIILFFKVWGMTNNVKKMKDIVSKHAERSYYDVLLLKLKDGSVNFARLENLPDVERILLSKV